MAEQTPEWWRDRLYKRIIDRRGVVRDLHDYYDGLHRLQFATAKFRETFGALFRDFADNWCALVCDAVEERLGVRGFRVTPDEEKADGDAWRIWQENQLDAQSQLVHTEALICGEAYAIPWLSDVQDTPEVTVESPWNVAVEYHPKLTRRRSAGLRVWVDEEDFEHAELFLPDAVHLYRSTSKSANRSGSKRTWDPDTSTVEAAWMANPVGVVPVVPFTNNPRLSVRPNRSDVCAGSEIQAVRPLQDAVNKLVADLLVTSNGKALPFRYVTGYEPEMDPQSGEVKAPPFTKADATWAALEEVQAKFGSLQAADLGGFVEVVVMLVQHIASITRTPPHYLNASADRLSGESLRAAETGLVAKVRRKQTHFGESWEEVMRLCGRLAGVEQLATASRMETIWKDPESRTEAEHVDAALKKQALGVPNQQLWEDLDYSPQQIERFRQMATDDALVKQLATPAPQPRQIDIRRARDGAITGAVAS